MQAAATQQSTTAVLPHRPVQWRRAARALWQMMGNYDSRLIMDYAVALEGDDGERGFQDFLAQPGARELDRDRPCLAAIMDDWDRLEQLRKRPGPRLSRVARRDRIRVGDPWPARTGCRRRERAGSAAALVPPA